MNNKLIYCLIVLLIFSNSLVVFAVEDDDMFDFDSETCVKNSLKKREFENSKSFNKLYHECMLALGYDKEDFEEDYPLETSEEDDSGD